MSKFCIPAWLTHILNLFCFIELHIYHKWKVSKLQLHDNKCLLLCFFKNKIVLVGAQPLWNSDRGPRYVNTKSTCYFLKQVYTEQFIIYCICYILCALPVYTFYSGSRKYSTYKFTNLHGTFNFGTSLKKKCFLKKCCKATLAWDGFLWGMFAWQFFTFAHYSRRVRHKFSKITEALECQCFSQWDAFLSTWGK